MTTQFDRVAAALADHFRLERELGQGGMATVYLAEDLKHRRKVAVKVLRPELAASLGPDRFFREIEVAAQLQHPHILPLFDSGASGRAAASAADDDSPEFLWYAMPFVDGETLRDRLARTGELPVHDAVRILIEVADALAHAHKHGVAHRDIKPENILLSGRHALVSDFGVAKAVSEATGRQQLTTAGVALGTPAYMAPEQAAADPHLDHRVDIYALGILAYELLTGRTPFSGRTPQETLAAHVMQTPEAVSRLRPGIAPSLEAIVMKCLAKRPADRFQSAEELVAALEPLATPSGGMTPTYTQPVTGVAPMATAGRKWAPLIAVAVIVVGAGGVLLARQGGSGPEVILTKTTRLTSAQGLEVLPAISPDGQFLAYVGRLRVHGEDLPAAHRRWASRQHHRQHARRADLAELVSRRTAAGVRLVRLHRGEHRHDAADRRRRPPAPQQHLRWRHSTRAEVVARWIADRLRAGRQRARHGCGRERTSPCWPG